MNPNKLTPGYNVMWESSRMMLPEHREQLLAKTKRTGIPASGTERRATERHEPHHCGVD